MPSPTAGRINFVLPGENNVPMGGYKVVYEYANGLAARGFQVRIVLAKSMEPRVGGIGEVKNSIWPRIHQMRNPGGITWFKLDPTVELVYCSDIREKWLPEADFSVATGWRTARFVADYSPRMGRKLYLIQHLETWAGPHDSVIETWKLPLHKIVISKWLAEFAHSQGETCTYIPNGISFDEYGVDAPIETRPRRVSMLYHTEAIKGTWDGINSLELAREAFPDLSAVLYGVPTNASWRPPWIEYVSNASSANLRRIYNSSSIYLHPSWSEGWPLPPAEAMACGAAVVAEANQGVMDYLKAGETAMTSRPRYWLELAENLKLLLSDDQKRVSMARAGVEDIQQYTWNRALDSFVQVLVDERSG